MKRETSLTAAPPKLSWPRRHAYPIAFILMVTLHLGLTFYYERVEIIFNSEPNAWLDYDTHIEQVRRAVEALDRFGKSWSYDPYLLAGNPNGTLFGADNKGWEMWTYVLWKLGVPKGMGFNLFILLAHLLVPWVVFFSARLFGLDKWSSLLAASMGLFLWYFDSFPHWFWWCGMIAYGIMGYLCLLPTALFYRYLKGGRWVHLVILAVVMSLAHLIHPYAFFILVFPLTTLYIVHFRKLSWIQHVGIFGVAATVVATNAYWLIPAMRFFHYIVLFESGIYCQTTPIFILTDYLGLLRDPVATGVLINRTGLRFICFLGAIFCLVAWRKDKDDRFWPFFVSLITMLSITYLGGYSSFFTHIQPYRHLMPAMYFSIIPAAAFFMAIWRSGALKRIPPLAYSALGLGLIIVTSNLARDVLYFLPNALPERNLLLEDELALRETNPQIATIKEKHMEFRHVPTFEDYLNVAKWVNNNYKGKGRILVEGWVLGEHLSWRTNAQILGGFRLRNIDHSSANLFRRFDEGEVTQEDAKQYFENYAVKWVILSSLEPKLESYNNLLKWKAHIDPVHRIYQTTVKVSFFAEGSGKVKASLNRIEVKETDPKKDIVLRYHWLETLVCENHCRIVREPLKHDPVGFIRVPAPHPRDFVIKNGY